MIDVMDKINRIQRRQVMISCGIFLALLIPFLVVQFATMISSDLLTSISSLFGEWFFPFFIIMICANIGLSLVMRHLTSRRCRAVLEESNGKCE